MHMKNWLVFALIAWCPAALAIDEDVLATLLEDARAEMKMPGLRAAVRLADGRIVRASVGLADKEAETPLDDSVGMPGGSTGKTFVAALAMLLVQDGTLSLDDPASKWLGDTSWYNRLPNAREIRVRHLLSHTSGISDYPSTLSFRFAMIGRVLRHGSARFEPEELIGFVLGKKPLFPPGEGFRYTDAGYLVLGRLIEAATGRNYYDLLAERILEPHELHDVRPADTSVLTNITPGYMGGARNLKKDGRMKFDPSSEWTGGGLITNPTMLVQFYAALAEGRIVRPESFAEMLDGGWRNPKAPDLHYGFGVFVRHSNNSFGHGGLWPGYRTHVGHHLPTGTTIAVQTNRDGRLDMEALVNRIAALVLKGKDTLLPE
jgi:D-alanyl-D-alanine carboxypeptidase